MNKYLKFKFLFFLVTSLLFLINAPKVSANNFYLDSSALGTNTGLSWSNAWKSPSEINFNSIKNGDILYISGGTNTKTYSGTITIPSGSAGLTITKGIDNGHNGEVVFKGDGTGNAIKINAGSAPVSNLTISNLTLTDYAQGINAVGDGSGGLQGVTIDNLKIINFKRAGIFIDGYGNPNGNKNIVVKNSYFNDDNSFTSQSDGIYIQVANDFTADHNTIILDNNYTENSDLHSDNIQAYYVKNITYSNNYLIQRSNKTLGTQMLFTEEGAVDDNTGIHNVINNVLIRDCPNAQDGAIRLKIGKGTTFTANVVGNTYYGKVGRILNSSVKSVIRNNIFYSTGSGDIVYSNSEFSNNLTTNPIFVNPNFVNPDLHLQSTSPAINGGINLGSIGTIYTFDNEGNSRGTTWDIGAYEYSGQTQPTNHPNATPVTTPIISSWDINQDSLTNIVDIGLIVNDYGSSTPKVPRSDINKDGVVNILDIGIVIDHFKI